MRALIIGEPEKAAITVLKAKAAGRIVDAALAMKEDPAEVRARNADLTIPLPRGFQVTFTIERQPVGMCEHISVSVDNATGLGPNPAAVEMILDAFGMRALADSDTAWTEYFEPNRFAVNVLQKVQSFPV